MLGLFLTMLTVLFVGLKLTNKIDWSWWQILMPLWLPMIIITTIWLILLLIILSTSCGIVI